MEGIYLTNSGFLLTHQNRALMIDAFDVERYDFLSKQAMARYDSLTILSSHHHPDHYRREMLQYDNAVPVLGRGIPKAENGYRLSPGQSAQVNGLTVTAHGSTDIGVSFHIQWDGFSLFHAGDFNCWHWSGEGDTLYTDGARRKFYQILEKMEAELGKVDVAFFPVDPRMGADYWEGAREFARRIRPDVLVPMHFSLGSGDIFARWDARETLDPGFFSDVEPLCRVFCADSKNTPFTIERVNGTTVCR